MIIIQLESDQLSQLIHDSVRKALQELKPNIISKQTEDSLLTVKDAAEFLNLTVPTIYSKVSRGELPVMKRSKRLYFSQQELLDYLKGGRKKTNAEIDADAENHLLTPKG